MDTVTDADTSATERRVDLAERDCNPNAKVNVETTTKTVSFKVHGMTCNGCAASVTRVLLGVAGVERATVVLDPGSAEVTFDPARAGVAALKLAVEGAGYDLVE